MLSRISNVIHMVEPYWKYKTGVVAHYIQSDNSVQPDIKMSFFVNDELQRETLVIPYFTPEMVGWQRDAFDVVGAQMKAIAQRFQIPFNYILYMKYTPTINKLLLLC